MLLGNLVWSTNNPVDVETLPVAMAIVILVALVSDEVQVSRTSNGWSPFMTFLNALLSLATSSHASFMGPLVPTVVAALLDSATSFVLGWVRFTLVRFGRDLHNLLRRYLAFAFGSRFLEMDLPCRLHYTVSTENNANDEGRKSPRN